MDSEFAFQSFDLSQAFVLWLGWHRDVGTVPGLSKIGPRKMEPASAQLILSASSQHGHVRNQAVPSPALAWLGRLGS